MNQRISVCRICGRRLTNPRSISVSMGPVCVKRFGIIFEEALEYARTLGRQLDIGLIENAAIIASQEAYRNRLRRNEPAQSTEVEIMSRTLGRMERVTVESCDGNHGRVITPRGTAYDVTHDSCTCPDYRYRLQDTGQSCRHMDAFRMARGQQVEDRPREQLRAHIDEQVRQQARRSFEFIDWREQEAREGVLEVWKQNRSFDGVLMSEDNQAWEELLQQASGEWEYKYENVLGGTGNSFGMEIEFELPRGVRQADVSSALYRAGLLNYPEVNRYRVEPGFWKLVTDGSLKRGLELVSPILFDRRETWEQIEKATQVLKELGATVSNKTGGHIHVGIAPLDHQTYAWQRLSRIGFGYEKIFYRMGGADATAYRRNGSVGKHRGIYYSRMLSENARNIRGTDTAEEARRKLSNRQRYTLFNATNVDNLTGRKPTIEMRYPNSTLDASQWQAQIQVANAIVHQSAVITNETPFNRFTPRLNDRDNQLRQNDMCSESTEKEYFRRFLDVLGNHEDRKAAAWLFVRGRS